MAHDTSTPTNGGLTTDVTYEDLINLEYAFDDAELTVLRAQTAAFAPLYLKREALAARIPNFWPLVVEQAPPELDQYIQPSDSALFAECLQEIKVNRFEGSSSPEAEADKETAEDEQDSPRSFTLTLRFDSSKNRWFSDETLTKTFRWRRARDGWTGLVSEPVRIRWKPGRDLTGGLTDAACALWESRCRIGVDADTAALTALPEHKAVAAKLETNDPSATSFFTFFGFVSERRYVSAAESKQATQALHKRRQAGSAAKSTTTNEEDDEDSEAQEQARAAAEQDAEVCPHGADVANVIAEDLYPDAIRYFTSAQEQDDADVLSEDGFEVDDEDEDVDDEIEEIDIRALVTGKSGKRGKADGDTDADADGTSPRPRAKSRKVGA